VAAAASGSKKRQRLDLHIKTVWRCMSPRQWKEDSRQKLTPPPQKLANTNSSENESSRSRNMSRLCHLFVTLLANMAN